MTRIVTAAVLGAVLLALPASAAADVLFTPYIGWNWGGSSGTESGDIKIDYDSRSTYGLSVMWLGGTTLGFEADFATIPDFFQQRGLDGLDALGDNGVTTYMGNLVLGSGGGGFRPYLAGGLGLIRQRASSVDDVVDVSENSFGFNVGGGLRIGGRRFGVRGDVRYFRSLQEPEGILNLDLADFRFWRGTLGVTIGF